MKFCQNCGAHLSDEARFCESCGVTVVTETQKTEEDIEIAENKPVVEPKTEANEEQTSVKKKKFVLSKKLIAVIAGVVAIIIALSIVISGVISNNKYEEKLELAYESILNGADNAESYATLQSKVWRNCIYEQESVETDKYTTDEYGDFYSDFNDALSAFYDGENIVYLGVSLNVSVVDEYMSELKDGPKKFDDKYRALKELYIAYSDLTDLVVGTSSYSYNTFSEALEEAKSNYKRALSSAKLLLE